MHIAIYIKKKLNVAFLATNWNTFKVLKQKKEEESLIGIFKKIKIKKQVTYTTLFKLKCKCNKT